ncbi:MAG: hypothetical protein FWE09_05535 [Treponema sp.]|nr:hypothetical protein [Treponema sp.]
MKKILALAFVSAFFLSSCLGATMDITMRANGSGRIVVEYRVSQALESMGRFDGNERWNAIPVGRADMERSVARVPGLRLSSFSSSSQASARGGADLVSRATLDFDNPAALLAFLDITGSRAGFESANGQNVLRMTFLEPSQPIASEELLALFRDAGEGYEISLRFTAPANAALRVLPGPLAQARAEASGRVASFAIGTGEIPAISNGLEIEISW